MVLVGQRRCASGSQVGTCWHQDMKPTHHPFEPCHLPMQIGEFAVAQVHAPKKGSEQQRKACQAIKGSGTCLRASANSCLAPSRSLLAAMSASRSSRSTYMMSLQAEAPQLDCMWGGLGRTVTRAAVAAANMELPSTLCPQLLLLQFRQPPA